MLKSLFASCLFSLGVSTPSLTVSFVKEPSKAITQEVHGDYEVSYKYQSNEVNDYHDIILGNIYSLSLDIDISSITFSSDIDFYLYTPYFDYLTINTIEPVEVDEIMLSSFTSNLTFLELYFGSSNYVGFYYTNYDSHALLYYNDVSSLIFENMVIYFDSDNDISQFLVFLQDCNLLLTDVLSYTDYNEISSVTRIERHSNLYTLIYDFYYYLFENHTLSGITTSYNMPFDSWIAHTMTIITLLTLIVIIFFFLRWLFRVVSGFILLKH